MRSAGLSTSAVRVSPGVLADVPWPAGDLTGAVDACRRGEVEEAGRRVLDAYGCDADTASALLTWWVPGLPSRATGDAAGD